MVTYRRYDSYIYKTLKSPSKKKILEVINEYSKVSVYKISIQKLAVFLYTNNELSEREIKKCHL